MKQNKGVGCGFGCLGTALLFVILLALFFSCNGGNDSEKSKDTTTEQQQSEESQPVVNAKQANIEVNQTLEFGGYKITITRAVISGNTLTAYVDIYNNNVLPLTVNQIMGFYAYQGDANLNGADFKSLNSALLDTTIQPGETLTDIDLVLKLASETEPIELTFFPDDTTGYNETGATEMDVTINPVDGTANTEFQTY